MDSKKITGNKGEQMAAEWLRQKGFGIIERNWRYKYWEVDIIASMENKLHFFEVKTRTSNTFGHPEESIGEQKMKSLRKAAEAYTEQNPQWKYLQFDVLSITMLHNQPAEFFLIEDVYF